MRLQGPGGSSPLSRGILVNIHNNKRHLGIIPALAGNTAVHEERFLYVPDHPRSRGEYKESPSSLQHRLGSSPLSRGIPPVHVPMFFPMGIIPALAGNTRVRHLPYTLIPDHPRSRGEYVSLSTAASIAFGSSPLSRGIPGGIQPVCLISRIIPALAGNTIIGSSHALNAEDHPRSRGEYIRLDLLLR